jgi:hypothetical protein
MAATGTATERTVFVLGRELEGNREAVIVESGSEYFLDPDVIVEYSDDTAQFPYSL